MLGCFVRGLLNKTNFPLGLSLKLYLGASLLLGLSLRLYLEASQEESHSQEASQGLCPCPQGSLEGCPEAQ